MNKYLADVETFHKTYGLLVPDEPGYPDVRISELRLSLINEEHAELTTAIEAKDIVGIADALVDLLYVVNGGVLDFGLQNSMSDTYYDIKLRTRVMDPLKPTAYLEKDTGCIGLLRAYVSLLNTVITSHADIKYVFEAFWLTIELIFSVAQRHGLKDVFEVCHDEVHASNMSKLDVNGKPIFREDGKVLKGPNFFKPKLAKIIGADFRAPSTISISSIAGLAKVTLF